MQALKKLPVSKISLNHKGTIEEVTNINLMKTAHVQSSDISKLLPAGGSRISSLPVSHRLDIPRVCPFKLTVFKAKWGLLSDTNHKKCFCVCKRECV